jgi:hypothetical protein
MLIAIVSLHQDLIEQAEHLATRERRKPRQASLRRAVSAAYYALIRMLTSEAALKLVPKLPDRLRDQARRAFAHLEMKNACEQLTKSSTMLSRLLKPPLEAELLLVAKVFIELQQKRHAVDYDLTQAFNRTNVLALIANAKMARAGWSKIRNEPNAVVFLAALLLNSRWNR